MPEELELIAAYGIIFSMTWGITTALEAIVQLHGLYNPGNTIMVTSCTSYYCECPKYCGGGGGGGGGGGIQGSCNGT